MHEIPSRVDKKRKKVQMEWMGCWLIFYNRVMQGKEQSGESHPLEAVIGNRVKFVTNDGRVFLGILKGLDQTLNCVISQAEERVYSEQAGVATHPLGTYFIRGECIVAMGAFAETEEELQGLEEVRAKPITTDN